MTSSRPRILVCVREPFLQAAPEIGPNLESLGLEVQIEAPAAFAVEPERLLRLARDADFMIVCLESVTEPVLREASRLRLIVKHGAGVDNIDVEAATRRGICVANLPGLNADAVADLTVGLALALARRIVEAALFVRGGGWDSLLGTELTGKTYGVIGVGRIGRRVVQRIAGFGVTVLGCDIAPDSELAARLGFRYVPLDDLLASSDVISLHVPLKEDTRGFIDRRAFRLMKPGVLLVNVARGGVVDEDALVEALENRVVRGAAVDVFAQEPPGPSRLMDLPNVLPTPHMGGSAIEAAHRLANGCVEAVSAFLNDTPPPSLVNPEAWLYRSHEVPPGRQA